MAKFALPVPSLVIGELLGMPYGDQDPGCSPIPIVWTFGDVRSYLFFGFGVRQCFGQPLATDLDKVPFMHDGFVYGLYEPLVGW